ncbi:1-(5-phosphoribosyl)-5-amino-4-imidazole-carboxylate carboxylase [Nitrospira sp.]|nr:1-(5-phosphoribosyl)-5-amino-4-imidazole-carboxylate carboxylase [Nitrospira sp.]
MIAKGQIERLLQHLQDGTLTRQQVVDRLHAPAAELLGFATVDHHRAIRQGFPEVIFCEGKTTAQVVAIARGLVRHNGAVLATRVEPKTARALLRQHRRARYHETARVVALEAPVPRRLGHVLIITAGTADVPIAEEARVTAETMGSRVETLYDVGVAGLHRLLSQHDRLEAPRAIIVAAGMDGVLPSVVGGLVSKPVIAVPTSRGYGASFGGLAALLTMLNSCAAGVGVMNIDNGFGAGCLAHRINILAEEAYRGSGGAAPSRGRSRSDK